MLLWWRPRPALGPSPAVVLTHPHGDDAHAMSPIEHRFSATPAIPPSPCPCEVSVAQEAGTTVGCCNPDDHVAVVRCLRDEGGIDAARIGSGLRVRGHNQSGGGFNAASCVRFATPTFENTRERCVFTVSAPISSSRPMVALVWPARARSATRRSVGVSECQPIVGRPRSPRARCANATSSSSESPGPSPNAVSYAVSPSAWRAADWSAWCKERCGSTRRPSLRSSRCC